MNTFVLAAVCMMAVHRKITSNLQQPLLSFGHPVNSQLWVFRMEMVKKDERDRESNFCVSRTAFSSRYSKNLDQRVVDILGKLLSLSENKNFSASTSGAWGQGKCM